MSLLGVRGAEGWRAEMQGLNEASNTFSASQLQHTSTHCASKRSESGSVVLPTCLAQGRHSVPFPRNSVSKRSLRRKCSTPFGDRSQTSLREATDAEQMRYLEALVWPPHRRIARAHQDSIRSCAAALALPCALRIGRHRLQLLLRRSDLFGQVFLLSRIDCSSALFLQSVNRRNRCV